MRSVDKVIVICVLLCSASYVLCQSETNPTSGNSSDVTEG